MARHHNACACATVGFVRPAENGKAAECRYALQPLQTRATPCGGAAPEGLRPPRVHAPRPPNWHMEKFALRPRYSTTFSASVLSSCRALTLYPAHLYLRRRA